MRDRAGGADPSKAPGAGGGRTALGPRRVLWVSFGLSVAIHVIALLLYPAFVNRVRPENAAFPFPDFAGESGGIEVVRLIDFEAVPDPVEPEEPEVIEEVPAPEVTPEVPVIDAPVGPGLVRPSLTPAERMRPRLTERRLWQPLRPSRRELTLEQREELELAGRLEAWNDSMDAVVAAEVAATDWTYTDSEGRRWGVSPGRLHLGDITLPLPFAFGTPVGLRDEVNRRAWEWEELQRQGVEGAIRDSWRERAEAIRARRDAERRGERPDTSRVR